MVKNDSIKNSWKSIFFLWVLVLSSAIGVRVVNNNMDDRSKASDEEYYYDFEEMGVESECGLADGVVVSERPIDDLCNSGATIWTDSVGEGGDFNWNCVNQYDESFVSCSSVLE